jgi:cyclic di-GMP phosphodiesterase
MPGRNGISCLVVDDEPRLRRVIVHLLEGEGFRCLEAGTGVEALRVMESNVAPLVISDLRMPEMDGVSLLRHVLDRWPFTAVIMVSAVSDVDIAVKCLKLGAYDYVSKPFNLDEVRARVQQALQWRDVKLDNKSYQEELESRVRAQERRNRELFVGGVEALARALEAKDAYLKGHSVRVAQYAEDIAHQLGMGNEAIETIQRGGHLHDIGKIGVREEVLHKAAALTAAEYLEVMEHPVIGARILGPLLRDQPLVIAIVRSHHERMDGRGLPDGLKGGAIPPIVRIVSVADAFDAMTSKRPYRPSLPVDRALEELRAHRGIQWDPEAVDGFFAAFPDPSRLPIATPDAEPAEGPAPQTVG